MRILRTRSRLLMLYKTTVVNTVRFQEFLLVFPLQNISSQSRNNNKTNTLCSPSFKKLLIVQMSRFTEHWIKLVKSSSPTPTQWRRQQFQPTPFHRRVKMSRAGKNVLFAFWLISTIPGRKQHYFEGNHVLRRGEHHSCFYHNIRLALPRNLPKNPEWAWLWAIKQKHRASSII